MNRLILLAACLALPALADVTVTTVNDKDGKPRTIMYIGAGKFRMDDVGTGGMIWTASPQQLTMLDARNKTYMLVDPAEAAAAMKQGADMMKQAEAQLAGLPPEQREMMKKMMPGMAGMGGGKPAIEFKITKTGKSDNKGGRACQMVDVTISGIPMMGPMGSENCVVPGDSLGLSAADIQTLRTMAEQVKQMTKDMGQYFAGPPDISAMGGWPVWTKDKRTGESSTLKTVDKSAIAASVFAVPAGFKQQKMSKMGGPG